MSSKKRVDLYGIFLQTLGRIFRPTWLQRIRNRFTFMLLPKSRKEQIQADNGLHHSQLLAQLEESDHSKAYKALMQDELRNPELVTVDRIEEIANKTDVPRETVRRFVDWLRDVKTNFDENWDNNEI